MPLLSRSMIGKHRPCFDASDRNQRRRAEARVHDHRPGRRARGEGHQPARRDRPDDPAAAASARARCRCRSCASASARRCAARCWRARCRTARPRRYASTICARRCRRRSTSSRSARATDLEYKMSLEVLPDIPEPSFADLGIERLVVEVPDEDVDQAIERIAEQQRKTEVGRAPGRERRHHRRRYRGAGSASRRSRAPAAKDRQIVLGSGGFIPGFEEQLIGAAAGEHRTVRVTFPEDYGGPGFRRQGGGVRGRCEGGAPAPAGGRSTTSSARRSGSRTSPSCARRCGSRCSATMRRHRACA